MSVAYAKVSKAKKDDSTAAYLKLVTQFPIRPIRSAAEFSRAQEILDSLAGRTDLVQGQLDYLEGLVRFVSDYEHEHFRAQLKALSPIELLKHLMTENGMNTSELGAVLGSRGLASEVLTGKRGLSKTLIGKLSRRFKVEPALFLDIDHDA